MKKKILVINIAILLICHLTYSQSIFHIAYGTSESETIGNTEIDTDNGLISAGQKMYPSQNLNYFYGYLLNSNTNGDLIWAKNFSINGYSGYFSHAIKSFDKGFVAIGIQIDSIAGPSDILMVKTDNFGNVLWSKKYGSAGNESGTKIIETSDYGYLALGGTYGAGGIGSCDIYIIRTDSIGNLLWSRIYGGIDPDKGMDIIQTNDGGFLVVGYTYSFGVNNFDIYVLKIESNGNILWSKTYEEDGWETGAVGIQTNDGGYLIAGKTFDGSSPFKTILIKTTELGDTIWSKTYSIPGFTSLTVNSLIQTSDSNYVLVGFVENAPGYYDAYLFKVDNNGNCLWANSFSSTQWFYSVWETTDNGLIMSGNDNGYFGMGGNDALVVKTNSNGYSGCYQQTEIPLTEISHPMASNVITQMDSGGVGSNILVTANDDNNIQTNICYYTTNHFELSENKSELQIFPNPTTGLLIIKNEELIIKNVAVYDIYGKEIHINRSLSLSKCEIDISQQPQGIYIIKVITDNQTITRKLIKQ